MLSVVAPPYGSLRLDLRWSGTQAPLPNIFQQGRLQEVCKKFCEYLPWYCIHNTLFIIFVTKWLVK